MLDPAHLLLAVAPEAAAAPPVNVLVVYLCIGLVGLGVDALLVFGPWVTWKGWLDSVQRLKARPIAEFDGLLMLGLSLLAVGLLLGLSLLSGGSGEEAETGARAMGMLVSSLVLHWGGIAMILVWLRLRRLSFRAVFSRPGRSAVVDFAKGVFLYLGLVPLLVVYALVYEFVARMLGHEIQPQMLVELIQEIRSPGLLLYFGVLVALVGPLAEELAFRGVALPLLARRFGTAPAILALSAVFVLLHGSFDAIGPLFIVAFGFALSYLYTSSVWVAVGMHAAFNGVNLGVLLLLRNLEGPL